MTSKDTCWESFKVESASVVDRLKAFVHKGNVRRVVIEHDKKVVAEFPLTAGVVGVLLAPQLAAIAAVVALFKDCTVRVETTVDAPESTEASASA